MANVKFMRTRKELHTNRDIYDENALYFVVDSRQFYRADQLLTSGIRMVATYEELPAFSVAAEEIIYFVEGTGAGYSLNTTKDGWVQVIYPIATSLENVSEDKYAETIATVKMVAELISGVRISIEEEGKARESAITAINESYGELATAFEEHSLIQGQKNAEIDGKLTTIDATLAEHYDHLVSLFQASANLQSIDAQLGTQIVNEVTNRENADANLQRQITAHDTQFGVVNGLISTETSARQTTDANLQEQINTISSQMGTLSSAVRFLGVKPGLPESGQDGDLVIVGTKEYIYDSDTTVGVTVNGVATKWVELGDTTAELQAISNLEKRLGNEIAAREAQDTAVLTAANEAITNVANNLTAIVVAEQTERARVDGELKGKIDAEATARDEAIAVETTARTAADEDLQEQITKTKSSISQMNTDLSAAIGAVNQALVDTTGALLQSDQNVIDQVNTEKKAREDADTSLNDLINTAVQNLALVDQGLTNSIQAVQSNVNNQVAGLRDNALKTHEFLTPLSSYRERGYFPEYAYIQQEFAWDNSEGARLVRLYKLDDELGEECYYYYNTGLFSSKQYGSPIAYLGDGVKPIIDADLPVKSIYIQGAVYAVSGYAFQNAHLQEVVFDDWSVNIIGRYSFEGNDFTSITLPTSLTGMKGYSFKDCKNLKYVTFNSPIVPVLMNTDGIEYFEGCDALEAIYVPVYAVEKYKQEWPHYADIIQPKSADAGSQDAINELEQKMYSEIETLKGMINADYVNVSEEGV